MASGLACRKKHVYLGTQNHSILGCTYSACDPRTSPSPWRGPRYQAPRAKVIEAILMSRTGVLQLPKVLQILETIRPGTLSVRFWYKYVRRSEPRTLGTSSRNHSDFRSNCQLEKWTAGQRSPPPIAHGCIHANCTSSGLSTPCTERCLTSTVPSPSEERREGFCRNSGEP